MTPRKEFKVPSYYNKLINIIETSPSKEKREQAIIEIATSKNKNTQRILQYLYKYSVARETRLLIIKHLGSKPDYRVIEFLLSIIKIARVFLQLRGTK